MHITLSTILALVEMTICHLSMLVEVVYRQFSSTFKTNFGHWFVHNTLRWFYQNGRSESSSVSMIGTGSARGAAGCANCVIGCCTGGAAGGT